MKNSLSILMTAILVLLSTTINAQKIKNAKTETIKVYGNCGMCETKIEKAGNVKNVASVDWNKDTGMATITYDATKTNKDEILKRIALVGYDSDSFLAPDDVYDNLHGCCQYDRVAKVPVKEVSQNITTTDSQASLNSHSDKAEMIIQKDNQLQSVFENYFAIKDALVQTDGSTASTKATALLSAINAVKMDKLEMDVHMVWMKVVKVLKEDVEFISATLDTKKQRKHFNTLSKSIYDLIKVSQQESPTYYQFCPMANDGKGANWLSKENVIKNPYYGSMMLKCGKVVETIK